GLGLVVAEVSLALALAHDVTLYPLAYRRRGRSRSGTRRGWSPCALGLAIGRMAIEHPSRREFTELVTDHFFVHEHRNVLLAIIDAETQPDELRQNGRTPTPYLDHFVSARGASGLCLAQQIAVDKRAFPN